MNRIMRWLLKKNAYEIEVDSLKAEIVQVVQRTNDEIIRANHALKISIIKDIKACP